MILFLFSSCSMMIISCCSYCSHLIRNWTVQPNENKKETAMLVLCKASISEQREDGNIIWLLNDAECINRIIQTINLNGSLANNYFCASFLIKANFTSVSSSNIQVSLRYSASYKPLSACLFFVCFLLLTQTHKQDHNIPLRTMCVSPCGGKIKHQDCRI